MPPTRSSAGTFKPFEATEGDRKKVRLLSGYGMPHEDIGIVLGIDDKTLRKYFAHDLALGMAEANAAIGQKLFQQAISGNVAALIYWTKARMGWREVSYVDATLRSTPAGLASDAALEAIAFSGRTLEMVSGEDPEEPPNVVN